MLLFKQMIPEMNIFFNYFARLVAIPLILDGRNKKCKQHYRGCAQAHQEWPEFLHPIRFLSFVFHQLWFESSFSSSSSFSSNSSSSIVWSEVSLPSAAFANL